MAIQIAKKDREIIDCFPVMHYLRSHLKEDDFLAQVREQEASAGYQIAYVRAGDQVVSIAGFRISHNLAWGKFLYVDDLVTDPDHRSKGYGAEIIAWLKLHARDEDCAQVHLDSGLQRVHAHRFYEREGMVRSGYHFVIDVP